MRIITIIKKIEKKIIYRIQYRKIESKDGNI